MDQVAPLSAGALRRRTMRPRPARLLCLIVTLSKLLEAGAAPGTVLKDAQLPRVTPPESLPVLAEHRYQVNGRIRLFLFVWVGRDNVGSGRLVWRGDERTRALELLIGTDPARAPRGLNRWGYLAEVLHLEQTTVVGVMTESSERTLDEARTRVATDAKATTTVLRALRSVVSRDETLAMLTELRLPRRVTYTDAQAAFDAIDRAGEPGPLKRQGLPPGTRPGFLTAAEELVRASLARAAAGRRLDEPPLQLPFVYNAALYDLLLREAELVDSFALGTVRYGRVIRGRFAIRQRATGRTTTFTMAYGTEDPVAGVPLHILYQPRWWLQIELVHVPDTTARHASRRALR
jgi:hypothetical protein